MTFGIPALRARPETLWCPWCSWRSCSPFLPLLFSLFLHYLNAFLGWRLASRLCAPALKPFWCPWCSWRSCSPFLRLLFSLFLHYLNAFLGWRLASRLCAPALKPFWCPWCSCSPFQAGSAAPFLTIAPVSHYCSSILMHSLGDVWHPGSARPPWNPPDAPDVPDASAVLLRPDASAVHFRPALRLLFSLFLHYSPLS